MPALLIVAHAPLASGLKAVAEHTFPDCARVLDAIDVEPATSPEAVEAAARAALARRGEDEALILTDVYGATPANAAARLADGARVRVVAGVNVPMLWRSLCYVREPLDALVARALAGAAQGVREVAGEPAKQPGGAGGCA